MTSPEDETTEGADEDSDDVEDHAPHTCYRCGHASLDHHAGGCILCGCTSPYGGTT